MVHDGVSWIAREQDGHPTTGIVVFIDFLGMKECGRDTNLQKMEKCNWVL